MTVAIFIFMTALVVANYGSFNDGTLLTSMSYDVALALRGAQSYGLNVKGIVQSDRKISIILMEWISISTQIGADQYFR